MGESRRALPHVEFVRFPTIKVPLVFEMLLFEDERVLLFVRADVLLVRLSGRLLIEVLEIKFDDLLVEALNEELLEEEFEVLFNVIFDVALEMFEELDIP